MNISSLVVYLKSKISLKSVSDRITHFPDCEVIATQDDKIIVIVQSELLEGELDVFKKIHKMPEVADVSMVYSYQDLDEQIDAANSNDIADIVRKIGDKGLAQIKYGGTPRI